MYQEYYKCGTAVDLQGDNIGTRIIYGKICPKCGKNLMLEIDARINKITKKF